MPYTQEEKEREYARIRNQFSKCNVKTTWDELQTEEIMLPMQDGVRLHTIVYRPKNSGHFPAVVSRSCYFDADEAYRLTAKEYARRGIAYIYQYCRGTGSSEGIWEPNVNERSDGKTLLDWVDSLDWVESIGYTGCSYLALTGWVLADILPPKVKTMYLTHYGVFRHVSAYQDGLFRHDILTSWAMWNAGVPIHADYMDSCKFRPHADVDERLWNCRLGWYKKWVTSPDRDDNYWNSGFWGMLKGIPSQVTIPLYIGEGWYDHHLGSCIETYNALPEEIKRHSTFLIGAWDHNFNFALENREGNNVDADEVLRCFLWFHNILSEHKNPEGRILSYVCNDDRWIERPACAEPDVQRKTLYFAMGFNPDGNVHRLSQVPGTDNKTVEFVYDPNDPAISHGAESLMASSSHQGSLMQPPPGLRKDTISFLSETLEEDMVIYGSIQVHLRVRSTAADTAFYAKIMEVMSTGETYYIRGGITTLAYRGHSAKRCYYEPSTDVDLSIDMWDIAWKLGKGSKIRIDITSSDFPQYAVHSNFAGIWSEQTTVKTAQQVILLGTQERGSSVLFPILKEEC